jgi:hypothetical protein
MRGMSASGRAFDEDLPYDERRQAAIEASVETLAPLGLIGIGTLAKQPAKNILLDTLTLTGAPSSMTDAVGFDPGRRKFLQQSLAAAGTAAVAPDILSDLGTKATKVAAKSIGNIDAAVSKLIGMRKNSSALIERGLNIESNIYRQTSTPKPPKDNKLLLSKDYADKLELEEGFRKELIASGNKPQKEVNDLYSQADSLNREADTMAYQILETIGDNPEVLPTLESQTIEDLIGSFNIDERMGAAQETDAYMALVEEAIRRGMHKDYEKYPMTDIAAEYTLKDIEGGFTSGMVDLRNIDLNVSPGPKKRKDSPRVIKEGVSPQEALKLTDEDIELFRRPALEGGRGTTEAFRKALKGRNEELTSLANQLKEGNITVREYRQAADRIRPIRELNSVPEPARFREIVSALDAGKRKKPIVGLTTTLSEGDEITARLDINAYTDYDVWVPTLTHNKQTMYKPTVVMRNVEFIQPDSPAVKKAMNVAAGQAKAPFAVMKGNYVDVNDYDAFSLAKDNFKSDEWIQVGYDPTKRGYFYDRSTGEPVLNAEEVIQVGSLVLAKNARKGDADAFAFSKGGMAMDEQMNAIFKSSRGYAEGGEVEVDPVSGNEVPPGSMPEEVRDDIDARLSEGEYVVPADVVRYFGVKLFEDLRIQAKRGMAQMDAEGRIGGEPMSGMEIVEPEDDLPFDMEDLEVVEVMEMDEGGDVGYARRGMITSADPDSPMGALGLGTEGLGIGATSSNVEMKKYVNEDGHSLMIMFINGVPQQVIPAGYFLEETEAVTTEEEDTTTDTEAEAVASVASSRDDKDPFKDIPMPEGVNYKELTYDEMVAMVKDNQSMKGDLASTGMGIVNPILGIVVKLALMNSKRQLENEMKRRLDAGTLTSQEQSNLADLLKSSQEGRTGFMRALFGDEATTVAYKPIVTSGAPVNTSTINALADEAARDAAQKLKDDEAAARRRLAELQGIAASESVAWQVSGSTAGAAGTTPAVGTSDTTTGGVVGGYSTSDLADQYGSYGAGKPKPPRPSAKPYSSISGSDDNDTSNTARSETNAATPASKKTARDTAYRSGISGSTAARLSGETMKAGTSGSGPFNEGGLVKRRKKK